MESNYNFKKYVGVGSKSGEYFISLNKSGFTLSSGFYSKENISSFSRVILYFDTEKSAVGMKFTNEENAEGAFKLVHGNNKTTGSVSAVSFVKKYNLNNAIYFGRKIPQKISYEGAGELYVIELKTVNVASL